MFWVAPAFAENTTPALLLLVPGAVSAQHWSCPLDDLVCVCGHGTMGSTPVKRYELAAAHCHSKKAPTQLQLGFVFWGDPGWQKEQQPQISVAVFPASFLQHSGASEYCSMADGFCTPVFQVFMDLLPVKWARGCIPWAPEMLPCSGSICSPSSLPAGALCQMVLLRCPSPVHAC